MDTLLQKYYGKIEEGYWWFQGMRYIFNSYLTDAYCNNSNLNILDIGCGSGLFTKDLTKFGDVVGLDIQFENLCLSNQKGIKKLVQAEAGRLPFKNNSFDSVTCFNLIEHLDEDRSLIKEIHSVLKDGCTLILATSAFNFLWSLHDISNQHKRRYTKNSIREVLSGYFNIEKITYTNFILSPVIWLGIVIHNLFCNNSKIGGFYLFPKFINNILYSILRMEAILIRRFSFPFGVSLLCTARKKNCED